MQSQLIVTIVFIINDVLLVVLIWLIMAIVIHETEKVKLAYREKKRRRLVNLNNLITYSDATCKSELCMNKYTFYILCEMFSNFGGLTSTRHMSLEDIVAMFLHTLAYQLKKRTVRNYFYRSGESVSRNFHRCLLVVSKLHTHLLKKPTLIPKDYEDCRWKCFR